jgi:hypothetical protein
VSGINIGDLVIYRHFTKDPGPANPGLVLEMDLSAQHCLVLWSSAPGDFDSWISRRNLLLVDEKSFDGL